MKKIYLFAFMALLSLSAFSQSSQMCFVQISFNSSGNKCFGDCNGTATTYPVGVGPFSFTWSNGATTQNLTGLCVGTYTVSVVDANDGSKCSGNGAVTCPALLAASTSSGANYSTAIVSGGTFPYTYSWSPTGQTGMTATGLTAGVYTVSVTDKNGCKTTATANITTTGMNSVSAIPSALKVYPNPASNMLAVEMPIEHAGVVKISLMNLLGEVLYAETVNVDKTLKQSIDISNFSKGVYFISVQSSDEITTQKVTKQ